MKKRSFQVSQILVACCCIQVFLFSAFAERSLNETREKAMAGNAKDQSFMGHWYEMGKQGLPKNYDKAVQWYEKAAAQGDNFSLYRIGRMYQYGYGLEQNFQRAARYLDPAARAGYAPAQASLGALYFQGRGVEKDYRKAWIWFKKAANQKNSLAENFLGIMYYNGNGVERDRKEAFRWFSKSAAQGFAAAEANMGMMYENDRKYQEALMWYKRAADKDNETGIAGVKRMRKILYKRK